MTNNIATNANSEYYTVKELANETNYSTKFVYGWIEGRKSNGFPVSILKSKNEIRNTYRINKKRFYVWFNKDKEEFYS